MINETDFQKLKTIPENIQKIIKKHGYLTGSVKFNCSTEKSDYDIILHPDILNEVDYKDFFNSYIYYDGSYNEDTEFRSFYTRLGDKCLNLLIFWNEDDYIVWRRTTDIFNDLCSSNTEFHKFIKNNKNFRVQIFEMIKGQIYNE